LFHHAQHGPELLAHGAWWFPENFFYALEIEDKSLDVFFVRVYAD
jgi:hypothetical protein